MDLAIHPDLLAAHSGLAVRTLRFDGLQVARRSDALDAFLREQEEAVRARYALEELKDVPSVRAYRDFFWRVGVDPTKVRPAAEALRRRVLRGRPLPRVNALVDAYNAASLTTGVALAAFDADRLAGSLTMRPARPGEAFLGIGMDGPLRLAGREVVLADAEGLVAVYPYRDADRTKATLDTTAAVVLVCGVPGLSAADLVAAGRTTAALLRRYCGGTLVAEAASPSVPSEPSVASDP